ncbi:MAG: hypothetical protein N3F67_02575 [Acidilobaceae archaeon]|nr:hypothetical protein [Acidilobaceae archaeon]
MKGSVALSILIIALMMVVPYTLLKDQRNWLLYLFWTVTTLAVLAIAWVESGRWK